MRQDFYRLETMIRSAARTIVGCFLCLPLLVSAMRYETGKVAPPSRNDTEHDVQDVSRDITEVSPPHIERASNLKVRVAPPPRPDFRVTDYDLRGIDLARKQIARGLEKRNERRHHMDQSFEGLRDLIRHSSDPEIKRFLPVVNRLERAMERRNARDVVNYVEGFITDFAPLALYIENETGLPASVTLAQLIVESGWGASNITILKNNVLGIGNCQGKEEFVADLDFKNLDRDIRVRCHADTRAFEFDSVADSVLYYTYLLLKNEKNEVHYSELRRFIRNNRDMLRTDPKTYRSRVIALISDSYHHDPDWYENYLRRTIRIVDETGILPHVEYAMRLVADADTGR